MRGKSALLAVVLILAILLSVAGGAFWILNTNYLVDFKIYPKNAASMDLREEDISIEHYEALRQKLPECEILWNVPFQNGKLSSDVRQITVDTLSEEDVAAIACFPGLEIVHAENCRDYESLKKLRQAYPDLTVSSCVVLDGTEYPADTEAVELKTASAENLSMLPFLTELKTVTVSGGEAGQDFNALSAYCRDNGLTFRFCIGGETVDALKTVTYAENGAIIKETVDKTAFGHRLSPYCAPERIVIGAEFELNDDDGSAYEKMTDYNKRRREKQPINYPSAGSVFKRPEGHFAGALIEQAGLKGTRIGGAEVSTLHAGFIINAGGATSRDVYELIRLVQQKVKEHSGVQLETEVKLLGEF